MHGKIHMPITQEEGEALSHCAFLEDRDPTRQAQRIIRIYLIDQGFLPKDCVEQDWQKMKIGDY